MRRRPKRGFRPWRRLQVQAPPPPELAQFKDTIREATLGSLPKSFLREHALLLGRPGRHEDALRILYSQEKSLELALEYCDVRHERQQAQMEDARARGEPVQALSNECAYTPLVKVALDSSDPESERGIAAAIQVLALRRDKIDKAAALRLLPRNIPMSAVARPFLISAVVENESELRRLRSLRHFFVRGICN